MWKKRCLKDFQGTKLDGLQLTSSNVRSKMWFKTWIHFHSSMKTRKTTQWKGKVKHENINFLVGLLCAIFFMQHAFKKLSFNMVKSLCA
jgi:hypothetical protein